MMRLLADESQAAGRRGGPGSSCDGWGSELSLWVTVAHSGLVPSPSTGGENMA